MANGHGKTALVLAAFILLLATHTHAVAADSERIIQTVQARRLLQSQVFEQCKAAFDSIGGSEQEIAQKLPACAGSQPLLGDCCSQVKSLLSMAPDKCMCDWEVWNAVQARAGGNAGTLKQFLDVCGIPNHGTGNCY